MKIKHYSLIVAVFSVFSSGCTGISNQISDIVFIPHPGSDRRVDENVELELFFDTCEEDGSRALPLAAAGAPAIAEALVNTVGKILAEEAKRYEATYSANVTREGFYCPDKSMALSGFRLTRSLGKAKPDSGTSAKKAMTFCAATIPARDPSFFQIVPLQYELQNSKAKVVAFDLTSPFGIDIFNPWEVITDTVTGQLKGIPADNAIDMNISITLTSHFISSNSLKEAKHTHAWKDSGVKIGSTWRNKDIPQDMLTRAAYGTEADADDEFYCKVLSDLNAPQISQAITGALGYNTGIFFPKVVTSNDESTGVFNLEVAITEFDAYGERINELSTSFTKNKEDITKQITETLE